VPLGPLFGAAMSDASGIAFGPGGIGWWIAVATVAYAAVSLWAVLPLHERAATAFWLTLSLSAWSASAACTWLGRGRELLAIAAQASWSLGGGLAAVAMLAAARSVIREVRGQCRPATARSDRRKQAAAGVATKERAVDRSAADEELPDFTADPADDPSDDSGDGSFVDGSEQEQRHLSKAERKRLKKLARMNRVAA
jgi:hypothetical protein